jgi:hypothetical protein
MMTEKAEVNLSVERFRGVLIGNTKPTLKIVMLSYAAYTEKN